MVPTRESGSLDHADYFYLEGRADDVIVRGGEDISPGEIEDILRTHESVFDVAVCGIPDKDWGEAVAAEVVTKQSHNVDEEELKTLVKNQLRSSRPPSVIRFDNELPCNEMGTLLRRVVKVCFT
jgi:acyl-coenzyme A synthetase/AMP-(fatty) acid ligase